MTLPPGMFPPPLPQFGPQPSYGQHLPPGRSSGPDGPDGPQPTFSDVFDFSFDTYVTPGMAKAQYMIVVAATAVAYVLGVIFTFAITLPDHNLGLGVVIPGTPFPGLVVLVLGWVPALLTILASRMRIEMALATVRTAMDVRTLRERADLWFRHPGS